MTQDATELLKRAPALTPEERAELAGSRLESLDAADDHPKAVEAAWSEELARRIDDLDSGKAKTVPWEAVQPRVAFKLTHGR
jgi:putative addiction module component (TIGR02574 family)